MPKNLLDKVQRNDVKQYCHWGLRVLRAVGAQHGFTAALDSGRKSQYCYNGDAMPPAEVRLFKAANGDVPLRDWLDDLENREQRAYAKCLAYVLELADRGYEMRRPHADFLRDGIYELRPTFRRINYRILYFFHGKNTAVLSHGLTKVDVVPPREIDLAIDRMNLVQQNEQLHSETW